MSRPRRSALTAALVFLSCLLGIASSARADFDLTGTWVVEYDLSPYAGLSTSTETIAQTASDLVWSGNGGAMTGTIDVLTGTFHVEGTTSGFPPAGEKNGQVSADGLHFSGLWTTYVTIAGFPRPVDFDFNGTRADAIVCGDGVRDPGEQCDDGAANGTNQCCDATCMTVDPDADGICSRDDNCPNDNNPDQANVCGALEPLVVTKARITPPKHPDNSVVSVQAALAGPGVAAINGIASFRVHDASFFYDRTETDFACVRRNARSLKCKTPDKTGSLQIATGKKGTTLKAKIKHAAVPPSSVILTGPITVSFTDDLAVSRTGSGQTCTYVGYALECRP